MTVPHCLAWIWLFKVIHCLYKSQRDILSTFHCSYHLKWTQWPILLTFKLNHKRALTWNSVHWIEDPRMPIHFQSSDSRNHRNHKVMYKSCVILIVCFAVECLPCTTSEVGSKPKAQFKITEAKSPSWDLQSGNCEQSRHLKSFGSFSSFISSF